MKKIILSLQIIILAFGFFILRPSKVEAYKLSPEKATYDRITKNITIVAKPPATPVNAVKINIRVTNARVVFYSPPSGGGWLAPIGECAGQKRWVDNSVCFSIAKTSNIRSGESIGVITIEFNTYGNASFSIVNESYYSNGDQKYSASGSIGNYTIKKLTPTTTTAPTPTPDGEVTPTPSGGTPTVTPTGGVSGTPTVEPTGGGTTTPSPSGNATPQPTTRTTVSPTKKAGGQSKAGNTLLLLFVGGLMVLGALFGLAMLLMRKKKDPVEEAFPVYTSDPNDPGGFSTGDYPTTF